MDDTIIFERICTYLLAYVCVCTYLQDMSLSQENPEIRYAMKTNSAPAPNGSECNCLAIRQAARHISQVYDAHFASVGLRATQYSILAKLNRLGPLSIKELAAVMVMDRTTLGRAIRPLEREKLLEICGTEDGRKRSVRLTETGAARVKTAQANWLAAQRQFEAAFGESEAAALRTELRRVISAAGPVD